MNRTIPLLGVLTLAACSRAQETAAHTADSTAAPSPATANTEARPAPESAPAAVDSLRGELELVSNDPVTEVIMRSGDSVVVLRGPDIEGLRRVAGLEVAVRGRRTAERVATASPRGSAVFEVSSFAVRRANGEPAVDGVLELENGQFYLRLADGTRAAIAKIPSPLRGELGSRIFLVGAPGGAVTAFGIITESR